MVLTADRILTGEHDLIGAAVVIEGDRIVDVISSSNVESSLHLPGWLIPGFVDLHVHGGGGGSFNDPDGAVRAINFHRAHGSTSMAASLVSSSMEELETTIPYLKQMVTHGELIAVHLEGPFLSRNRAGAQRSEVLIEPQLRDVERLQELMATTPAIITIAPELDEAIETIRVLSNADWLVALGHSDATFAEALVGVNSGARLVTHLFNGMRPMHHRDPGLAELALLDPRMTVELILDGQHISATAVEISMRLAERRWIAVTDAIAAAGMGDGFDSLGSLQVQVRDGVARLSGTNTLAGSTLTMDEAFSRLLTTYEVDPLEAVQGTSTRAAEVIGRMDIGRIAAGAFADLLHWKPDDGLQAVMRRGTWLGDTAAKL